MQTLKPMGWVHSLVIFGTAALVLFLETHIVIPMLSRITGLEPVLFWFLVAGLGLFLPLLLAALWMLGREGRALDARTWRQRLRFRPMTGRDGLWILGAMVVIGGLSYALMSAIDAFAGPVEHQPPFMSFEPLTPGRYWILAVWLPYWLFNIMGEEILWRGVILPRQQQRFGASAWLVNGVCWTVFHIPFGWHLMVTMLPILFILPWVVQRRQNCWIGVAIHALVNGPSFIAIALGVM
jgi:membrane protease YdiL (CAAX protease family)